jgi:hypothetical protein
MLGASCAFGLGKRRDCAFQPMLMRRERLKGSLPVEEFVELTLGSGVAPVDAVAPFYVEGAILN